MYDCIIIGAGPAGLMASITINKDKKVLVIEKNNKPGKKLLLTGNGRCNITNLKDNNTFIETIKYNKKYLYSTINNFGPYDIYEFFNQNNVPLKEEKDNKIFPKSDKAIDILNALLKHTKKIEFNYNETVNKIEHFPKEIIVTTNKTKYKTKNLIIATGGTSFKQTGSTGDHMLFASMLNQPTVPLFPLEVGVITNENSIPGVSFEEVIIKYNKKKIVGNLIYTHKGLGGSAIMSLSEELYKNNNKEIYIDFLPNISLEELKIKITTYNKEKELSTLLNEYFTKRFSNYLLTKLNYPQNIKIKNINNKMLTNITEIIKNQQITIKEVDNINNAYVTGGGIDMKYINSQTMESTINENIYFIGESLDIHGPIGGYNLTLALSTGKTAGDAINKK